MESQNHTKIPQPQSTFCSFCGEKVIDGHHCYSSAIKKPEKVKQQSSQLLRKRKNQLKDLLQQIKLTNEQNTNAILAVAHAERSLKEKLKFKESMRDQLAGHQSQALALSLKILSQESTFQDLEDESDDYSYDSKLLKAGTDDTFAFLNKSIGKYP